MSIAGFSIRNSVLVNMFMIGIFIAGIFAMTQIPREEYPAVDFGSIIIVVPYPGVSPQEIEQLVINKIEEQISDIDGIDYIQSSAEEGRAIIRVAFEPNVDSDKAWNDLNTEMDKVNDLPSDAQDPIIIRLNMREVNPIGQVVIGGDFSRNAMREIADDMKEGFLNLDGVSKADIIGTQERQIWIDADQAKLDQYGLTLSDLQSAVQGQNLNLPGGTVDVAKIEFMVRSVGEFNSTEDIASMIVRSDANGNLTRFSDVATVRDTLAKAETISKLNGTNSVSIYLYKKADANIIKVMQDVRQYAGQFEKQVPGLKASVRNDGSIDVKNGLGSLGSNAVQGIILVFVVLFVALGWRNALLASVGIPFSIFATLLTIYFTDITLNNLTIFGLIIVVGMIVDNSIVVIENTHRYREEGLCLKEAIIKGTDQVIWPVAASTLTTLAAFLPLLIMEGMLGKFMQVFPIVVSIALFASFVQSMIVLPSNLYQFSSKEFHEADRTKNLIDKVSGRYEKILIWVLRHRALTVWSTIVMFVLSFVVLGLGLIKFEFFPSTTPQTITLQLQTPLGTKLDVTNKVVTQIEDYITKMKARRDVQAVVSNVGTMGDDGQQDTKTSNAQISIDLVDLNKMQYSHDEIKNELRTYIDKLPGVYSYKFAQLRNGPPVGKDVELRVEGDNLERLEYIGDIIKANLKKIPGVVDIEDDFVPGKKEVRIIPNPEKVAMYGLSVAQIAGTLRTASSGTEVSKFRGGGLDEYDIIVKLDDRYTQNLEQLLDLKIHTRTGDLLSLRDVADISTVSSLAKINHRDEKRVITITAAVTNYQDNGKTIKRTPPEVVTMLLGDKLKGKKGLLENFESRFPGYTLEFGGVQQEQTKSYSSLFRAFLLAILIIFTILAAQFKSYVQPLIVMTTVPFAFIGVMLGLILTGLPFSLNTLISVIALAGVVVNNAILLIDFINTEREAGVDRWHAIIKSGTARLRPIILTTGTTVGGMLPLVFSNADASQVWRPLAVSFTFGLLFSTFLTLFVIPCIYSIVDSFFGRFKMTRFTDHEKLKDVIDCKKG